MSNKTPLNTPPDKRVALMFTNKELNTIMDDINMRSSGYFGDVPPTFDILKDKIKGEIDRRKELLKSLGGDKWNL